MKYSKAVLAGLIALSIMGLTACGTNVNVTTDQSNNENSAVASSSGNTSGTASGKTSGAVSGKTSSAEGTKSSVGESKSANKSDNSESIENNVTPNAYGYYEETNLPASGVSVAALAGSWVDNGIGTEILTVSVSDDLYKGNFSFRNDEGKVTTGYVKLEYSFTPDDQKEYWYTFYQDDGTLWNAFGVDGSIPLNVIYAGQSGDLSFTRTDSIDMSTDENQQNVTEIGAYVGTYSEGKGVLTFSYDGMTKSFNVTWPLGAGETREWNFTAEYDDVDTFFYTDCVKIVTKTDEDGSQTTVEEYTGGTGSVTISQTANGTYAFTWNDNQENIAAGSLFIKG